MKSILATAALALFATAGSAQAQPATYAVDPTHTFVTWEALHFGTSTSRGRFGPVAGTVVLDRAAGREIGRAHV